MPQTWVVEGNSTYGSPVKETFSVTGDRAQWTTLDGAGEAVGKDPLYVPNHGSAWVDDILLKALLAAKDHQRAILPSGTLRMETIHELTIGAGATRERVTAYAIWGLGFEPELILARGSHLVATFGSPMLIVEDRHKSEFSALTKLGSELTLALIKKVSDRVTHPVAGPLWITNVHIFDPASGKLGGVQNVGVFRGVIVHVGSDGPPADATIVDGGGATLLPGLLDSHAHTLDWSVVMDIACGVTLVRDPGNDNDELLALERQIDRGEVMGPRIVASGFLEGNSPYSARIGFVIDSLEEGLAKVRWYANHGYWGLKIYNSMKPDYVKPLAAEAHRLGLHVSGHVPAFMSSQRAIEDGYDEINHINQLMLSFLIDPTKDDTRTTFRFTALGERLAGLDLNAAPVQNMIRLMKQHHTTLDPTMTVHAQSLLARPGQINPVDVSWIDHAPDIVQRGRRTTKLNIKPENYPVYDASYKKLEAMLVMLWHAGVPLVPGTDSIAGIMLHSELEEWVRAGIPAPAVLTAATLGGARFLGLDHTLGTVERGKLAYLYLVDGDPTQDIRAIRRGRLVVKGESVYYPDEIDEALSIKPFATHVALVPPAPAKP